MLRASDQLSWYLLIAQNRNTEGKKRAQTGVRKEVSYLCFAVLVTQWKLMGHIKHGHPAECVIRVAGGAVGEQLLVHVVHDVAHAVASAWQSKLPALPIMVRTRSTHQHR